jgi:ATP-binding cassette subfamily A (ABC1) protein 1
VSLRVFLEWWQSETVFEGLQSFMQREFGERSMLLERSGAHSFRYRITRVVQQQAQAGSSASAIEDDNASSGNGLSDIFAKFEAAKEALHVKEYSVGQTTLEQIFNQFAGAQDNPEVAAQQLQQQQQHILPSAAHVVPSPPVVAEVMQDSKQ